MDFSSAVQWWEQDQLRVLVLGSLAVQYFLFFFAGRRKSRIPHWYRFFIWLSYLASDALAIYALATLFNRQKKMQYRSRDLQVMWAPILLIHLGGQLVITAYDIEDNELWKRHIITALSQANTQICCGHTLLSPRGFCRAAGGRGGAEASGQYARRSSGFFDKPGTGVVIKVVELSESERSSLLAAWLLNI